jgi:hypothetical protein
MGRKVIFLVFCFLSGHLVGQSQTKILDYIVVQDYEAILQSFTPQVDVSILSYEGLVSKNEAVNKLREFLSKNKPTQYILKHKGKSKDNQSGYQVSDLYTQNGIFRLFVYLSEKNGVIRVSEFRIEKS